MLAAREKLRPLLGLEQSSGTWRNDAANYHQGEDLTGSVNLSPAWFPQGYDVSAQLIEFISRQLIPESGDVATTPKSL
jgi:hypothetical protein